MAEIPYGNTCKILKEQGENLELGELEGGE